MDKEETKRKDPLSQSLGRSFERIVQSCELADILVSQVKCLQLSPRFPFRSETFLNPDLIDFLATPDLN